MGLLSAPFSFKRRFFVLFGRNNTDAHNKGEGTKMHYYFNSFFWGGGSHSSLLSLCCDINSTNLHTLSAIIFYSV